MQNATGFESAGKSGASAQRDPDGTCVETRTVVCCDRCPREADLNDAREFALVTARWAALAVQVGASGDCKALVLCHECVRSLRLFLLGATERETARVGERWESVVSGAV